MHPDDAKVELVPIHEGFDVLGVLSQQGVGRRDEEHVLTLSLKVEKAEQRGDGLPGARVVRVDDELLRLQGTVRAPLVIKRRRI